MLLDPADAKTFFRIQPALLDYTNQRLGVVAGELLDNQFRIKVRDALYSGDRGLIEQFAAENPARLSGEELDIVRSWRHGLHGRFYILRQLKKHAIFLSTEEPRTVYGVVALTDPIEKLIASGLPALAATVLLPFKDKIIYDGLLNGYSISFGPGIRRSLNESFKEIKEQRGIVTTLPASSAPDPAKPAAPKHKPRPKAKSKVEAGHLVDDIIGMTDRFCREHLNEEYADLCRAMARKLSRKRPSPLISGKPATWAGAIVCTIGWVNFLDDPSQKPHMALRDLDRMFGIGGSSGQTKSAQIRKMLRIDRLEPQWTLPSKLSENPRAWMIEVNGFIMDARHAPAGIQEEAFRKGLIPYVPGPPDPVEKAAKPAKAASAPPPKEENPNQMKLF